MATSDITGVIDAISHRDRGFTVVKIGGATCSGTTGPVAVGMPVAFRVRDRSNTRYQDRYAIEARVDAPGVDWRRTCGVIAWLERGGLPMLGRLTRSLIQHHGDQVAGILLAGGGRIREIDQLDRTDVIAATAEVSRKHPAIYGAALLGEIGMEWAVELLIARGGPDATTLVTADPFELVRQRIIGLREANLLAEQLGVAANDDRRIMAAGAALELDLGRSGDMARPVASVTRSLINLMKLGTDRPAPVRGIDALEQLVASGSWQQRGELAAPAPAFAIADEIVSYLDWVYAGSTPLDRAPDQHLPVGLHGGERAAVTNALTHGLSFIETEAGCGSVWFEVLTDRLRSHRRRWAVVAPDARGSLTCTGILPDGPRDTADVVVVVDAHRYGYETMLRLLRTVRDGAHLVLAGDSWLWSPNGGGSVFTDLSNLKRWPTAVIQAGSCPAAIFRRGDNPVHHPRLVRSDLERVTMPVVRSLTLPSVPKTFPGATVLAGVDLDDRVGAGARGEIRYASPTEWRVAFFGGDVVVRVTDRLDLVEEGRLPVSLLPGVAADELGMGAFSGVTWTRRQIYAALSAATGKFHFDDPVLFQKPKDEPRRPNPLDPHRVAQ